MSVLVTGTLAIDHIAKVADGFKAGDLNGKLDAPVQHWGGCGMNLAYGFAQSACPALPWVFYGGDLPQGYRTHLKNHRISADALCKQQDARCAAAYIFTRDDGSQLTGFYPGSTRFVAPTEQQQAAISACSTWVAGPEDDATLLARLAYVSPTTPLYWMPGQYTEVTRHNVLEPMLARTPNLLVNEKEWLTLQQTVGEAALNESVGAVFITRGSKALRYRLAGRQGFHEQDTPGARTVDPTGCGDAFAAALVAGLITGDSSEGAIQAAIALAQQRAVSCLGLTGAQRY